LEQPAGLMKILLASNYFHPEHRGGIETVASNLAAGYREAGHEVRWVAADCGASRHRGHPDDVPVPALNVTEERLGVPYPLPGPRALGRLASLVSWSDVVHLHDCLYLSNVALFALSRRRHRPVLLTQHIGMVPYRSPVLRGALGLAYRTIGRRLLEGSARVTFVSPVVRDWFSSFVTFAAPPVVCPNGVDTSLFRPAGAAERAAIRRRLGVGEERPLLLFVGRFVEKKGAHLLRPIAKRRPDWSWLFVGRGDERGPDGWGLRSVRVLRSIPQDDLRDLYAAADVLLLPSVGEGLPMAILEALACGTPVLTTRETAAGAGPGATLLLTADRTSEAMEAAAAGLLETVTSEHRDALAEQAARQWRWESISRTYLDLLSDL
jgi:glycosyltransferase involved in cell wall biosynthesis